MSDRYKFSLLALLPPGKVWNRADGSVMSKVMDALAQEADRVHVRGQDLLNEAFPDTTSEMLADWERIAGLPDECIGELSATEEQRRNDLVARLADVGDNSVAAFIAMVEDLGFTEVTIEEFTPLGAGSEAGAPASGDEWRFVFRINVAEEADEVVEFTSGDSSSGDSLLEFGTAVLECYIDKRKPAHTLALYAYGATP